MDQYFAQFEKMTADMSKDPQERAQSKGKESKDKLCTRVKFSILEIIDMRKVLCCDQSLILPFIKILNIHFNFPCLCYERSHIHHFYQLINGVAGYLESVDT